MSTPPTHDSTHSSIVLCTLNSTYQHTSFGLRYLLANMQELQSQTKILEFTIKENSRWVAEQILKKSPKIVGLSIYIWNTEKMYEVATMLKSLSPEIHLVLGGPEISYETETQKLYSVADYIITGEADFEFHKLCSNLLSKNNDLLINKSDDLPKLIKPVLPEISHIKLPYYLYTDEDIKNRVIYVEASRGCPYKCEYCLSSLDKSVRNFNTELFLNEINLLIDRGARTFKFVDRTFNLSPTTSTTILKYFLSRIELGLFLHFEMVPDRLPAEIKELIQQFPEGSLQFEVGIQTLNPEVAYNVSRKNDLQKVKENFQYLLDNTHVHTHADLIVGLPGETLDSFAAGFDQLALMQPNEIQVGILKRLKGAPIARHEKQFEMVYQVTPPFQVLKTSTMDFSTLQKMNRFAKFWDLYANSGDFKNFTQFIKNKSGSFFWNFMEFVDFLSLKFTETHSISMISLAEQAWIYMTEVIGSVEATETIMKDYCFGNTRRDIPPFLKKQMGALAPIQNAMSATTAKASRQLKHRT